MTLCKLRIIFMSEFTVVPLLCAIVRGDARGGWREGWVELEENNLKAKEKKHTIAVTP